MRRKYAIFLLMTATACGSSETGKEIGPETTADAETVLDEATLETQGEVPETPEVVTIASGKYTLDFNSKYLELTLERNGSPLLRLPSDGLQLGRVDSLLDPDGNDTYSFDPWFMYEAANAADFYVPPKGLGWLSPVEAEVVDYGDSHFTAILTYPEGGTARLEATVSPSLPSFHIMLQPLGGPTLAFVRLRARVDENEGFYGLGAFFDHVEHRGHTIPMQLEADLKIESSNNEAHVRVPFIIGTKGWGMFVQSYRPMVFDVASKEKDLVEVTVGTGADTAQGLPFYFYAADHPLDITRLYYETTGYPAMPARWALGPILWRDEVGGQEEVLSDLRRIRELDLATTAYWIDRPYATAVNTFDFDKSDYEDPAKMIEEAHRLGFRLALWHSPYAGEKSEASKEFHQYALDHGYYPPEVGLLLNNWGRPIDFTNPEAYAWWQGLIRRYTDMGIEGFKLDYGEDVTVGLMGIRSAWRFHDGSDERTMHRYYNFLYHRVYFETLPNSGGFILARNAGFGDQVNITCIWPGDADSSFTKHREVVTLPNGEQYVSVGGLPATVMYGLSLGPSGFPYFGADTGGYRHAAPPDKELFTRWMQQTALSSVMQVGNNASSMPWDFSFNGKPLYDEESLGWYREYSRLHLRLWPYEWTYVTRVRKDGRPIQRPIGLTWPELNVHPEDEYLFGDYLLVAPVMERGATSRDVFFPKGRWLDLDDDCVYEGVQTVKVEAPLSKLPLFIAEGGIIPMLRPTIDTLVPVGDDTIDSYATTEGVLYVVTFPGSASSFELFDKTKLTQERLQNVIKLAYEDGEEFRFGAVFEVLNVRSNPKSVTVDGVVIEASNDLESIENAGWWWDGERGRLHVKVGPGKHTIEATW